MQPQPLDELIRSLERDGRLPATWAAEPARDETLDALWKACASAWQLVWLFAWSDRRLGVQAACACARTATHLTDDVRVGEVLETTEAWVRGAASYEALLAMKPVLEAAIVDADAADEAHDVAHAERVARAARDAADARSDRAAAYAAAMRPLDDGIEAARVRGRLCASQAVWWAWASAADPAERWMTHRAACCSDTSGAAAAAARGLAALAEAGTRAGSVGFEIVDTLGDAKRARQAIGGSPSEVITEIVDIARAYADRVARRRQQSIAPIEAQMAGVVRASGVRPRFDALLGAATRPA